MQKITTGIIAVLIAGLVSPAIGAPQRVRNVARNALVLPPASFDQCHALSAQRGDRIASSRRGYVAFIGQCMNGTIR